MSNFYDVNPNSKFCERTLNNSFYINKTKYYPEYVNSITSISMIIYGLIGLFYLNKVQSHFILFMYSTLVVAGLGSTLYHLTFMWAFALLDGFPMIVMSSIGLLIICWDLSFELHEYNNVNLNPILNRNYNGDNISSTDLNSSISNENKNIISGISNENKNIIINSNNRNIFTIPTINSNTSLNVNTNNTPRLSDLITRNNEISTYVKPSSKIAIIKFNYRISSGLSLIFVIYLFMTLIVSATAVNYYLYLFLFAFPLLPILIFMLYYYFNYKKIPISLYDKDYKRIRKMILISLVNGLFGLMMWLIDQLVCPKWKYIVYFWGHGIWHICIGYFAMSMITFASYLLANNYNYNVRLIYVWKIFPLAEWI